MLEDIKNNMNRYDKLLSPYACKNSDAVRLKKETEDMRPPFFHDIDRIIYSLSYTRYIDKTQVFSFNENDNISRRMTHVQMVSKVARTIGRALGLNEDLIEAAALGHDLGHVPFGHPGETILNKISLENNEGYFNHNIQSVRTLMNLEMNGKGRNITVQVLDAIMCHNGEFLLEEYRPKNKSVEDFLQEYQSSYQDKKIIKAFIPMTLEGCVVRISDIIAYIGKDIEDAIRLNVFSLDQLPENITAVLGTTNREIVNTVVLDVINNSFGKSYLKMSSNVFKALVDLKDFNYENIYYKANTKESLEKYEIAFRTIFNKFLNDLNAGNKESNIYKIYLNDMSTEYITNTSNARIVIDYIAGMTDDFLMHEYEAINL